VGPLSALKSLAGNATTVQYAVADDMEGVPVPASLFSHDGKPGLLVEGKKVPQTQGINYTVAAGTALLADSSATWSGTLNIPETGECRLHLQLLGCYATLTIDDQIVARRSRRDAPLCHGWPWLRSSPNGVACNQLD
jgi:beta-glucosidase